ncbi:VTT domain-containing protein [Streptomyces sp. MBT49]|uniref:DedA family protein n=1 Tax=Streptomyces sp. MBT49 TaxID=1488380 RepID=UPI0019094F19|nr:VTT domain-containing protein [Streptomyces sp. MBT49]MBK3626481.1 VTT domain-containing protein [Streptomyces sp. MBT49]
MTTIALGPSWLDPNYLLDTFGLWGLLLIVFAESGLLIGFFLPGDSLLFTAGLLITSNQLDFPLWGAVALICVAAILGDQAGYMFGKKVGPSLFNRPDSRLFKQENVTKAHEFFEKYGPKSLVLARFVPIVRTFTPIIAGVSGMRYRSFLLFNVIGGVLWGAGVTLLGSWLGNIDFVKKNIEAILILIVLISVVPIAIEFLRARSKSKKNPAQAPEEPQQRVHQQQPPVMDDATTQLRRIDRHEPQYDPQHPYGGQGHDRRGHQGGHQGDGQDGAYQGGQHGGPYQGGQQDHRDDHYSPQQYPQQQQYPQEWQQQQPQQHQPQQQPYGAQHNGQYPYDNQGY